MLTKTNKNRTIDLKKIIAEEYINNKKTKMEKFTKDFIQVVAIAGVIWFIIVSLVGWGVFHPIKEVNAYEGQKMSDIDNRNNARLERLKLCNKNIGLLKNYYLPKQDIGTRCATIMTLSKDRIPVKYIMQDIHTPAKAKNFWKIYYNIKDLRLKNGIKAQTYLNKKKTVSAGSFSINKLAYAVAMAETKNCTVGNSASRNNCFGIVTWKGGKRHFKSYKTKEDSYKDFKRIWLKYYKGYPNYSKAKKWTGNDRVNNWLRIVKHYY